MSEEKVLIFDKVDKNIGKHEILNDVSFDLKKGEVVGIIGSNGSGKTTILRLASGLSYPSKGTITINGKVIKPGMVGDLPSGVGILIESPTFMQHLTGFDNLRYLAKIQDKIHKEDIHTALRKVGLNPNEKKKVREYSLGMRQRLGIAQAIMENPNLILFDEPTNGLDEEGKKLFGEIINEYKKRGTGFLFVSHSREEIQKFCDRVFKIENRTLVLHKNLRNWFIVLQNLEDVEKVLQLKPQSRISERHNGNPVIILPNEGKEEVDTFFRNLGIQYQLLKVE